jgi:hypothetical protein
MLSVRPRDLRLLKIFYVIIFGPIQLFLISLCNRLKLLFACLSPSVSLSARPSFLLSVRLHQRSSHWMDFREIWFWGLLWQSVEIFRVYIKWGRVSGNLHEDYKSFIFVGDIIRHKSNLCNNQYCYIFDSDMNFKTIHKKRICVHFAGMVTRTA